METYKVTLYTGQGKYVNEVEATTTTEAINKTIIKRYKGAPLEYQASLLKVKVKVITPKSQREIDYLDGIKSGMGIMTLIVLALAAFAPLVIGLMDAILGVW